MKLVWPESQNRVFLKCGSTDSGSAVAGGLSGALAGSSALAGGVSVFGTGTGTGTGTGVGVGASGCCAYAGMMHVAAAISEITKRSVVAVQRIDLRFRFPICPIVNLSACRYQYDDCADD